jgi:hypothetical protein
VNGVIGSIDDLIGSARIRDIACAHLDRSQQSLTFFAGCGRRVSLKRYCKTSSEASKKST